MTAKKGVERIQLEKRVLFEVDVAPTRKRIFVDLCV
jgi:hypothetical protein